ncbi:MAG: DUF1062 domain-containing protein [Lachnospiraceae bacterium]|nr:DUF1062 domain-containing protein [Lachnospiraceae bacterium]
MSYLKKIEYKIMPRKSFRVIRNCSGCGKKTHFINTERFRVNANGNKIDVWLIYQCENCKHTCNLTVYERQKPSSIPKEEYQAFLRNDEEMAAAYGMNMQFFKKNKAEVDAAEAEYDFIRLSECEDGNNENSDRILVQIHNPYNLKLRPERQIAEVLGISGSRVKKFMEQEQIEIESACAEMISAFVNKCIFGS